MVFLIVFPYYKVNNKYTKGRERDQNLNHDLNEPHPSTQLGICCNVTAVAYAHDS